MTPPPPPRLVSPRVACELLGVSRSTLIRWEEEGKLKPRRLFGGHRRYWLHEIRAVIQEVAA
jgi:putative resolvase